MEGVQKSAILTHHDFRKKVAMAWINPELYWPTEVNGPNSSNWKKRKATASVALSVESDPPQRARATQISDTSLGPYGALSIRLDTTKSHFPEIAKNKARCSMHKWLGIETQKGITMCRTCNVNLCKDCFKLFHTTPNLVVKKEALKQKYNKHK